MPVAESILKEPLIKPEHVSMTSEYDTIGKTYTSTRAADPRITARLIELLALPTQAHVIDIGAGSGNYSFALAESGYLVMAVEPSATMRSQAQPHPNLDWRNASAEALPFADKQFDGAVMTLCLHHLEDWKQGLQEALRVCNGGPLIIFAFDIEYKADFWLFDYFPAFIAIDKNWSATLNEIADFAERELRADFAVTPFPIPKDLVDHFAASGWARPEIYLQKKYRDGISSFSKIDEKTLQQGLASLRKDLDSGAWQQKYGKLLQHEYYDRGYVFLEIRR